MLQPTDTSVLPFFLTRIDEGVCPSLPGVRYCAVTFNKSDFHDALFNTYAITLPAEMARAVDKRRAEYLAGRWCSHRLLAHFGVAGAVTRMPERAPCWPEHIYGSISHTKNRAIAVAVHSQYPWRIGVDIEHFDARVMHDTMHEIVTAEEKAWLEHLGKEIEWGVLLAFSAKESLYKALWPELRCWIDFHAAALVSVGEGTFTLRLNETLSPTLPAGRCIEGRWHYNAPLITTLISEAT